MNNCFKMTWRVSDKIWADDKQFEALHALFREHPNTVDDFAFFIAEPSNYGYFPIQKFEPLLEIFKKRAEVLRVDGKGIGLNIWPTFGESRGGTKRSDYQKIGAVVKLPFQPMVGMDGSKDACVACPVSDEFLEYSRQKFTLAAKAGPDFIWVDDDTRFTHLNGVPYPCFCDSCVKGFEGGRFETREELVAALNDPAEESLRVSWCTYGADRLAHYCEEVRQAVDAVDPAIDTPFMTVGPTHTTFSGDFIEKCMKILRSRGGRPGHGFYWDNEPDGMFRKAFEVGRQVKRYPNFTSEILYEEESYPYVYLDKSLKARENEVWLALTTGCTGVAYNHLAHNCISGDAKMFGTYQRELGQLEALRPAWETYLNFIRGTQWCGFWPADNNFLTAHMKITNGWFNEYPSEYAIDKPQILLQAGLPLTSDSDNACATLLSGKVAETFSDEELRSIFSKGVIMDAQAAQVLADRGYSEWVGVTVGDSVFAAFEELTEHPLNGSFAGYRRFGLFERSVDLIPLFDKTQVLANNMSFYESKLGVSMTYFENTLGGKVVVCGNSPWSFLGTPHKLAQFGAIAQVMGCPLILRSPNPMRISRIAPFVRKGEGKAAALLVNASLDVSEPLELLLEGKMTAASVINSDGTLSKLPSRREDERLCVEIPPIRPWQTFAVLAE